MPSTMTFGPIEIWHSMGTVGHLVLISLFLMSAYSAGIMIDRWLQLRRSHRQSLDFVRRARPLLAEYRLAEVAAEAARCRQGHLARIYAAVIRDVAPWHESGRVAEGFDGAVRRAADRERVLVSQELRRGLSGLASIGATAPFVGLFGTVIGIMNSFFAMATTGSGGIGAVSGGIAEALVNTAAGILVALPAVWGFNYFLGRMERVQSEMDNASSELADYLMQSARSDSWRLEATTGRTVDR